MKVRTKPLRDNNRPRPSTLPVVEVTVNDISDEREFEAAVVSRAVELQKQLESATKKERE